MATTPEVRVGTGIGDSESVVPPVPSCPLLLRPQHCTEPPENNAHVLTSPSETAMTPEPDGKMSVGTDFWLVVPSPNRP